MKEKNLKAHILLLLLHIIWKKPNRNLKYSNLSYSILLPQIHVPISFISKNLFHWMAKIHMCPEYSAVWDSWWPHGLQPARLFCPWDFPGKNPRMGCHFLLQGIFLTQGWNPCLLCLLHWQVGSLLLHHLALTLNLLNFPLPPPCSFLSFLFGYC